MYYQLLSGAKCDADFGEPIHKIPLQGYEHTLPASRHQLHIFKLLACPHKTPQTASDESANALSCQIFQIGLITGLWQVENVYTIPALAHTMPITYTVS
jgi:hypothetical protein